MNSVENMPVPEDLAKFKSVKGFDEQRVLHYKSGVALFVFKEV